jgi:hypothetical protein
MSEKFQAHAKDFENQSTKDLQKFVEFQQKNIAQKEQHITQAELLMAMAKNELAKRKLKKLKK